jgi:hypothetical protein
MVDLYEQIKNKLSNFKQLNIDRELLEKHKIVTPENFLSSLSSVKPKLSALKEVYIDNLLTAQVIIPLKSSIFWRST